MPRSPWIDATFDISEESFRAWAAELELDIEEAGGLGWIDFMGADRVESIVTIKDGLIGERWEYNWYGSPESYLQIAFDRRFPHGGIQ